MATSFDGQRVDFLSYQKLLPEINHVSMLIMLMEFLLRKLSASVFCHDRKWMILISNKDFKEKVDSMGVSEQVMILNKFAVLQLHVMKLPYVLMKSAFI